MDTLMTYRFEGNKNSVDARATEEFMRKLCPSYYGEQRTPPVTRMMIMMRKRAIDVCVCSVSLSLIRSYIRILILREGGNGLYAHVSLRPL